jgi:hypothetical protein
MRTNLLLVSALSLASLSGCIGAIDDSMPIDNPNPNPNPNPTPDTAGKLAFESDVKPGLLARCAGCHQGESTVAYTFLGTAPATTAYAAITNDRSVVGDFVVAQAKILTKGTHSGVTWWDATESGKITGWLTQEATDRNVSQTTPEPPPPTNLPATTSIAAMQKFAGCMDTSLAEWRDPAAYNIARINTGQGQCRSCHNAGAAGYWADNTNNYDDMHKMAQQQLFFTALFSTAPVAGTPVTYKVIANKTKLCAKGKERQNNTGTHPTYDCNNNNSMTNLELFVEKVNAKLAAGVCGVPGFKPPT